VLKLTGHTDAVTSLLLDADKVKANRKSAPRCFFREADSALDFRQRCLTFLSPARFSFPASTADKGCVVSGSRDSSVRAWDIRTGRPRLLMQQHLG
jgi:hypothetical protein